MSVPGEALLSVETYRLVRAGQRVLFQWLQLGTLKHEGNKHEKRLLALLNIWLRMIRVVRGMDINDINNPLNQSLMKKNKMSVRSLVILFSASC